MRRAEAFKRNALALKLQLTQSPTAVYLVSLQSLQTRLFLLIFDNDELPAIFIKGQRPEHAHFQLSGVALCADARRFFLVYGTRVSPASKMAAHTRLANSRASRHAVET